MKTTYSIYTIKNMLTGLYYVGKSKRPEKRKIQHFSDLRTGKHHSSKLQAAFDAYGESAFEWQIIETGVSEPQAQSREIYWIAHYNSYNGGYNHNNGTYDLKPAIPCSWNGKEYESIRQCAEAIGVGKKAMAYRVSQGYKSDNDMPRPNEAKECVWDGITYPSVHRAAKALGISVPSLLKRLARGYTSDEDMDNAKTSKPVTLDGVTYPSISAAMKELHMARVTIIECMERGKLPLEPRQNEARFVEWEGKTYSSLAEAARDLGIERATLRWRLAQGYTCDADMQHKPKGKAA
jgi:predicted GIY-YIG superfamily endonuclease